MANLRKFKPPVVLTMTDKAKRDDIYEELRASTDPYERQAVKFSGVQAVMNESMTAQKVVTKRYQDTGKRGTVRLGREQERLVFQSNWSVAYPAE